MAFKKRNRFTEFLLAFFYVLLRLTLGIYLRLRFRLRFENRQIFKTVKPPFLILPNHANLFDPFLFNIGIPWPIHWVAADANFRDPFLGGLLRLIGTIPKTKNMSDLDTVKIIHQYIRNSQVVGVFGEGQQTWTGKTLPLIPATIKLVQFLKVPVITAVSRGAFLARPRWSFRNHGTAVTIEYRQALTPDQIRSSSFEEISALLRNALEHDEYEYQKKARLPVKGKHKAECLEILGYTCPTCKGISTIVSRHNEAHCRVCGLQILMDEYGLPRFSRETEEEITTFYEWDRWQENWWRENIPSDKETVIFEDRDIDVFISIDRKPLQKVGDGTMILYPDRMEFHNVIGDSFVFPLKGIQGLNVFKQCYLEFYFDRIAYHVRFRNRHLSAYKWTVFYSLLCASQTDQPGRE